MNKLFQVIVIAVIIFGSNTSALSSTVVEENNYIKIERNSVELKSRLSQVYKGFEYSVKNIYSEPVKIISVNLWNDSTGTVAYLSTRKTGKQVRTDIWQNGKNKAVATMSLSLLGAAVSMPFATIKNASDDKFAQTEANEFNKQNIQNVIIEPNKKLVFKTLTVKNHVPALKLIYQNPITDENMTVLMKQY